MLKNSIKKSLPIIAAFVSVCLMTVYSEYPRWVLKFFPMASPDLIAAWASAISVFGIAAGLYLQRSFPNNHLLKFGIICSILTLLIYTLALPL